MLCVIVCSDVVAATLLWRLKQIERQGGYNNGERGVRCVLKCIVLYLYVKSIWTDIQRIILLCSFNLCHVSLLFSIVVEIAWFSLY